jgi:lipoic acid synthetase
MNEVHADNAVQMSARPARRPGWIKVRAPSGASYRQLKSLMRVKSLHTVCEEAHCPNIGTCWGCGTATFLILGDICTRRCRFCNVKSGRPAPLDWDEPARVAAAVKAMNLRHVVVTSVNRDERPDGGAPIFAQTIRLIRQAQPGCTVEVLIPDFKGSLDALRVVMDERPDVLNHNVETVQRLFRAVQPQDRYEWALSTLRNARRLVPDGLTKSGLMVGLGESFDEVIETMRELRRVGVDILTIGQYLQPTRQHWPLDRYYTPQEFEALRQAGLEMGFGWVESAPLVRSSYNAEQQVRSLKGETRSSTLALSQGDSAGELVTRKE